MCMRRTNSAGTRTVGTARMSGGSRSQGVGLKPQSRRKAPILCHLPLLPHFHSRVHSYARHRG